MVMFNDNEPEIFSTDLSETLHKKYPTFFTGRHGGEGLTKIVILAALGGSCAIGAGIIALRTGTEGTLAGIAFGGFALALGLASLVNAFDVSCEIGEHLDNLAKDRDKMHKRAKKGREAPVIKEHDEAVAKAASIRADNEAEGEAAAEGVMRMLYSALGKSAGVVGHGKLIAPPSTSADVSEASAADTNEPAETAPSTNGHRADREVPAPAITTGEA